MLCCDPSDLADTHSSLIPSSVGDSKARHSSYLVFGRFAGIFTACFMSISISACLKTQHPPMPVLCAEGWVYPHSPFCDSSSPDLECGIHLVFHSPIFRGTLSHSCLHLDILPPSNSYKPHKVNSQSPGRDHSVGSGPCQLCLFVGPQPECQPDWALNA